MTSRSINPPYPTFTDVDGNPLNDGFIYIGVVNLNPQVSPIQVYWDAELTIPAVQPIRTAGGYPVRNGTPAVIYSNSDFSVQVRNKNGSLVYSAPSATERIDGSSISLGDQIAQTIDTITALRAVDSNTVARAFVIGYSGVGDGGGGLYYYDPSDTTSADNGGSVIVASDGARWKSAWFAETGIPKRVVTCYGDSFTMGLSGGISYEQSYPYLVAQAKNWDIPLPADRGNPGVPTTHIGNQAYGGSQIASGEQIDRIMAHTTVHDDVQWILTGVNDSRNYGTTAAGLTTYTQTLQACLAWMCIPESSSEKLYANSSDPAKVLRLGSGWVANTAWYNGKGYHTNVQGDTFNFTVFGDTIYLALPRDTSTTGTCSITVDGVDYGTHSFAGSASAVQYSRNYNMGFVRITGLSRASHGVILTKTSATGASDYMRVDWVAGVDGAQGYPNDLGGPQVYVGNCCRLSATGYADGAPTWSNANDSVVSYYNNLIEQLVRDFASDGMNITLVDASKYYNPNTMQSFDFIHPNAAGHQAIARAFLEKMDEQKVHPKDRGALDRVQKFVGRQVSTASIGIVTVMGSPSNTAHFMGGGSNTTLSYNLKIVEGNYFRVNDTKHTWLIVQQDDAVGPVVLYKAPGTGQITGWDSSTPIIGGGSGSWLTPTLINSWVNVGGTWTTARYLKDSDGFVHLDGLVGGGTVGASIFVLPVGYRPDAKVGFAVCSNNLFGFATVEANGAVSLAVGSNAFVTLTGISFKAA